jgi:hypothetical protein
MCLSHPGNSPSRDACPAAPSAAGPENAISPHTPIDIGERHLKIRSM